MVSRLLLNTVSGSMPVPPLPLKRDRIVSAWSRVRVKLFPFSRVILNPLDVGSTDWSI